MAVRINRSLLTNEQKQRIRNELYMQPEQAGFFKKKRFVQAKDPVQMWSLDKPNDEVIVPYTFGNMLMGTHVNSKLMYPGSVFNFFATLRPHQPSIVSEAMEQLIKWGTTLLAVYPGAGKTLMSAYLASQLGGLTLVVYPIKVVETSWFNTFQKYTNAGIWLNNGSEMPSACNVILTMDTQFHKIPPAVLKMVRILVIDEAHMFCVPSRIQCLLGTTPQYVIACTATPKRSDGMQKILYSICGEHGVFRKSPNPFEVYCLRTGIKTEISVTKTGDPDWSKLVRDLCEDPLRNAMIVDLVEKNANHKIMILTWNKDHAKFLLEVLRARRISVDILIGNKKTYHDSRVLIGTVSKIGTGFDEQTFCDDWGGQNSNMMILTGSTKSLTGLEQITGRVFRASFPVIVDLVDDNAICKRHWTERRKWYEDEERKGTIHYINMVPDHNEEDESSLVKQIRERFMRQTK